MLIEGQSIQEPLSLQEINKVMGATGPLNTQDAKAMLKYTGIKFVFTYNMLTKITIFNEEIIPASISKQICYKTCRVLLNHGIQFEFYSESASMEKRVFFGQALAEILDKLGPPNKEYHCVASNCLFLNYFELGVDILIETQDYSLKKIILHSNNPVMNDFCFYDRCCFEMQL